MKIAIIFVLCSFAVEAAHHGVKLKDDKAFQSARVFENVDLRCCYNQNQTSIWVKSWSVEGKLFGPRNVSDTVSASQESLENWCVELNLESVTLNDSGLYQCWLSDAHIFTHGTYLQVYEPLRKTINLSESMKNKILTAEGVLLLLCVMLPWATLLFKSKRVNELEKKKMKKEEENIYQGLNLDDCCSTYDKIERSQAQGPYQDICNIMEEEEDIQLEKP